MKDDTTIKSTDRRDFIKKAGLGVGAAGAVAIGLPKSGDAAEAGAGKPGSKGYRETDHVKRFYASARF